MAEEKIIEESYADMERALVIEAIEDRERMIKKTKRMYKIVKNATWGLGALSLLPIYLSAKSIDNLLQYDSFSSPDSLNIIMIGVVLLGTGVGILNLRRKSDYINRLEKDLSELKDKDFFLT